MTQDTIRETPEEFALRQAAESPADYCYRLLHRGLEAEMLDHADELRATGDLPRFFESVHVALDKFNKGLPAMSPHSPNPDLQAVA